MRTYPLFKAHVNVDEALSAIGDVLRSGYINEGAQVTELSAAISARMKTENVVLTNSCTSALTMALRLSGVGPGDVVVSTPMTCVATNTPISNVGAIVRWADVDPRSGMVTPDSVGQALDACPKAKAVVAVAWAGTPPDMEGLSFVRRSGRKLILDAAHAFDARYRTLPVHSWADYTCYSFQAIKHFTTGDGGALVCADLGDHLRAKGMKWFGLDRDRAKDERGDWRGQQWDVDIEEAGHKFNMNNMAAALGLSQLRHIDSIVDTHRKNAAVYDEMFAGCRSLQRASRPEGSESSFWVYTVTLTDDATVSRDDVLRVLNAAGIMAGLVHVPNDSYTCFRSSRSVPLPGLRAFSERQFSLPCGWWLDPSDIRHIAGVVRHVVEGA